MSTTTEEKDANTALQRIKNSFNNELHNMANNLQRLHDLNNRLEDFPLEAQPMDAESISTGLIHDYSCSVMHLQKLNVWFNQELEKLQERI